MSVRQSQVGRRVKTWGKTSAIISAMDACDHAEDAGDRSKKLEIDEGASKSMATVHARSLNLPDQRYLCHTRTSHTFMGRNSEDVKSCQEAPELFVAVYGHEHSAGRRPSRRRVVTSGLVKHGCGAWDWKVGPSERVFIDAADIRR